MFGFIILFYQSFLAAVVPSHQAENMPEARLCLLLPAILRMNLGLYAVAPSQAPEAAYTTMVLEYVAANNVLVVDLGRQVHEGLEDLRTQAE